MIKLHDIGPGKECLTFLEQRIASKNYRGIQISQHNRYDADFAIVLLEELYKITGSNLLTIRNTDLSKRAHNTPDEFKYAEYTNNVHAITGRGTQDSIRKNLFVDFHRMGLIERYDLKMNPTDPYSGKPIKYVKITDDGIEFIKSKNNTFSKKMAFIKAIDKLCFGLSDDLLNVVLESNTNYISINEFMFFLSFIGEELNGFVYTRGILARYIDEYRSLSRFQRQAVVDRVQNYCNPDNFSGDKTDKRDYGNWKNEQQQIFTLLSQTALFELGADGSKEFLYIKVGKDAIYETEDKLLRSKRAKSEYFVEHQVSKSLGFELHHIIPLLMARNRIEFDALDIWKNLIYIDGFSHNKISQTGSKNIVLNFDTDNIILRDPSSVLEDVYCVRGTNVLYALKHKAVMQNFNTDTINSF